MHDGLTDKCKTPTPDIFMRGRLLPNNMRHNEKVQYSYFLKASCAPQRGPSVGLYRPMVAETSFHPKGVPIKGIKKAYIN